MKKTIGVSDIIIFAIMLFFAFITLIGFTDIIGTYPTRTPQNDGPFYNYYHDKCILIIRTFEFVLCRVFILTMIFWFIKQTLKKAVILLFLLFPALIIGLLSWVELGYGSTIKDVGPTDNILPIFPIHTIALFAYPFWKFDYCKKKKADIFIKIIISLIITTGIIFFYKLVKFKWGL